MFRRLRQSIRIIHGDVSPAADRLSMPQECALTDLSRTGDYDDRVIFNRPLNNWRDPALPIIYLIHLMN